MAEAVRNGLRHAEHLYRYSFNHKGFDAVGKQVIRETQHTDRHVTRLRRPVVPAGCPPHLLGKLIREAMNGECRKEADPALGETLGRSGKAWVSTQLARKPGVRGKSELVG